MTADSAAKDREIELLRSEVSSRSQQEFAPTLTADQGLNISYRITVCLATYIDEG